MLTAKCLLRILGPQNVLQKGIQCTRLPIVHHALRAISVTALSRTKYNLDDKPNSEFISGYEDIEELHNAPENVKRIFRLDNANQYELRKLIGKEINEKYGCNNERYVAELTLKINTLQKHCQAMPKDKSNKVFLQWLTDQRLKKLRYLKKYKFEKYLTIIKELDLPDVESTHSKWNKYKFRKFKIGVVIKKKQSPLDRKIVI